MEQHFYFAGLLRCGQWFYLLRLRMKPCCATLQKLLIISMYKMVLTFKPLCVTIQMKAKQQYIRVVLLKCFESGHNRFKSVDETLSVWIQQWKLQSKLFCASICVVQYSAKYHLQKVSYLVWFDRCDLPSCWTALSALQGNSIVTWTRRHWLAARRSACNEIPETERSTKTKSLAISFDSSICWCAVFWGLLFSLPFSLCHSTSILMQMLLPDWLSYSYTISQCLLKPQNVLMNRWAHGLTNYVLPNLEFINLLLTI